MILKTFSYFIAVFFFIFSTQTLGQTAFSVEGNLLWNDLKGNTTNPGLGFSQAVYSGSEDDLPIFFHSERLKQFAFVTAYRISPEEVTAVDEKMLTTIQKKALGMDWKVEVIVSDAGGASYLQCSVIPLRKNSNGTFERLVKFSLEGELTAGSAGAKRERQLTFANQSVLANGTWYKLSVAKDGIYKIDKNILNQLGVDVSTIDPRNINIYGNGGSLLPSDNQSPRLDDLVPNDIFISGEADGAFDNSDFILFYAQGTDTWTPRNSSGRTYWSHQKHFYSDSSYYFLRIDDTQSYRIADVAEVTDPETIAVNTFDDYKYLENEIYNLVQSGREFYGDQFTSNTPNNYGFDFPNITQDPVLVEFQMAIRSLNAPSSFTVEVGGTSVNVSAPITYTSPIVNVANLGDSSISVIPSGSNINVQVRFNPTNADASGWLDFIRVNARRNLSMSSSQMKFRNASVAGPGAVAMYNLSDAGVVSQVWDITDFHQPKRVLSNTGNTVLSWKSIETTMHEYIAFASSGYLVPTPMGAVQNQNLHALTDVDLVIITAPGHLDAANRLKDIHASEGSTVVLVTPEEVFNEFSSGVPDVIAFRMLMKMLYDRAAGNPALLPQNLLLFGDASYSRNRGLESQKGLNVLCFETDQSLSPVVSSVTDDYFVFLSDNDNGSVQNSLDCGVGRIPAESVEEGIGFVSKIENYLSANTGVNGAAYCLGDTDNNPYGPWRNEIVFVSDDQDGSGAANEYHQNSSDRFAEDLRVAHPAYDISKLYMDAFQQESTPGGQRYPDGSEAIRRHIQSGALVVCYIGHGGERGWAHERILDIPTIKEFTNFNRLPLFLTATCELARFDNPGFKSAGELLLLNANGGAIGMLTTTRLVFSGANDELDESFFDHAFDEETIDQLTLGRINMLTKNGVSPTNASKPNFSLLGDPAIKLRYPKYNVVTTSINQVEVVNFTDTLKALQQVEMKGYVSDAQGEILTDFNGFLYPTVFDKRTSMTTLNNDAATGGTPFNYKEYNRVIYKGKATVRNGEFTFRFVIPTDINYSVDTARVSYYGVSGNRDAHGYYQKFKIGGTLANAQLDRNGPVINLFMNDSTFVSGGITNFNPLLVARLKDENGINTVGTGVGHDLVAFLDGNTKDPIVLNDYYVSDLDTYKSGQVRYPFKSLSTGSHQLKVRAWDIQNNPTEETIDFVVADGATMALKHVLNYPNPFTTHTDFYFEHNQACEILDVRIQIFTVSGKLVKTLQTEARQNGFRSEPIPWDGTDDFGDYIGRGVYVYHVEVRTPDGKNAEQYEKLVILK